MEKGVEAYGSPALHGALWIAGTETDIKSGETSIVYRQEKRTIYRMWLSVFALGFLAGILLMNLGSRRWLGEDGIFDIAALSRVQYFDVDGMSFLKYELPQRGKGFLLLLLAAASCFGLAFVYFWVAWQGFLAGMAVTAAVIQFGGKGILLILAGIFPQHLLFIPAAVMMLCWCYQTCCILYFPEKCIFIPYQNKKRQYVHQLGMLLWIICVVMIGCILECYVNPILISDIVKFF